MSEAPIRVGEPDIDPRGGACGCCEGTALATLQPIENRPNLTAVAFRVGDHGRFKASMLTSLASADFPALADLGTRADDDFSIALIDAWAATCDVLTFYQERLANEAYLQTARERLSIGELTRLIGYRLHPGSAAETDLVMLLDDPPGAEPGVAELTVPAGVRVQSLPGPEEEAQVFETLEPLSARVVWNRLLPRPDRPGRPADGDRQAWLAGQPALQTGDALLFVGPERWDEDDLSFNPDSSQWDFRRVSAVEADAARNRTLVTWDRALDSIGPPGSAASANLRLYLLRDRASLFGYNAPDPNVFSQDQADAFTDDFDDTDWYFHHPSGSRIQLDGIYKSFVTGGWAIMTRGLNVEWAYRITQVDDDGLTAYAISGRSTRLTFDTDEFLPFFENQNSYRATSVYGGSEELHFADPPVLDWVSGATVELDRRVDDLPRGRKLIFKGRRARLEVRTRVLSVQAPDGALRAVTRGNRVTLLSAPTPIPGRPGDLRWELMDGDGFTGLAEATHSALRALAAEDGIEEIAEVVRLDRVEATDNSHSRLVLETALTQAFDRAGLVVYANVARAAHGEGVTEILGAGDPSQAFQKFLLKQAPVTQHVAPTATGIASTLEVRVDGVAWREVPDLYDRGPTARVFRTSLTDEGETVVEFGDGRSGARPTAGRDNIVAEYSKGLGLAGNLRAGQLTLPLDGPLGLRETLNPLPASGGDDPESAEDARRNAPIHTLTLGRIVSITDYRDFALGFPGVAKAESRWVWQGETRRVVVTVAGPGGAEIPAGSATHANLLSAFRALGDPHVGVELLSFEAAFFRLGIRVATDPAYVAEEVLAKTEARLRAAFGFAARDFAQPLAVSEIAAIGHEVPGVVAVDVDRLYRVQSPQTLPIAHNLLISQPGRLGADGTLRPAEILMLSPAPLDKLEVMA